MFFTHCIRDFKPYFLHRFQGLMLLAADNDVEVRKNVCAAFVSLVPLMDGIIEVQLIK